MQSYCLWLNRPRNRERGRETERWSSDDKGPGVHKRQMVVICQSSCSRWCFWVTMGIYHRGGLQCQQWLCKKRKDFTFLTNLSRSRSRLAYRSCTALKTTPNIKVWTETVEWAVCNRLNMHLHVLFLRNKETATDGWSLRAAEEFIFLQSEGRKVLPC